MEATPPLRALKSILRILDVQYAISPQGRDMVGIDKLFDSGREGAGIIQEFRTRLDLLHSHLEESASISTDALLYISAIRSLNIYIISATNVINRDDGVSGIAPYVVESWI